MIGRVVKRVDQFAGLCGWLGVVLVIALTVLMGWEVFMRYALNSPTKFSFDVSMMLQLYLAMGAANYVLREERHIVAELVLEKLPERVVWRLNVFTSWVCVAYCFILSYLSWLMASASLRMGERTMTLEAPVFPMKLAVCVGFAIFGIQFMARSYKYSQLLKGEAVAAPVIKAQAHLSSEQALVSEVLGR